MLRRLLALWLVTMTASVARAAPATGSARPKLLVLIAVDQMRADYITEYGAAWSHGLRQLVDGGARFSNARYPYLNTITCAGHATLGTGAYPHRHGMVQNAWWDREGKRLVECTEDLSSPLVPYGRVAIPGGDSARNILVPTLADTMKAELKPAPRVVSVSFKARSAIGLVGKAGDVVTWFEGGQGVTARAFSVAPIPWVDSVLRAHPPAALVAQPWTKLLPESSYRYSDEAVDEKPGVPWWTSRFPHPLLPPAGVHGVNALAAWQASALPDELLAAIGQAAVTDAGLGQGEGTDMLAIGFSMLDLVGHTFGPRSHEIQDVLARLDVLLGNLIAVLDQKVGHGRYLLALSADHGVARIPEQLVAEGQDAGRVSVSALHERLEAAVSAELGPGPHVSKILYTDLYLVPGDFDRLRGKPGALARVCETLKAVPGVTRAFSGDQLRDPAKVRDPDQKAAALGYLPSRSGDFVIVLKPNWIAASGGTTHGTQNEYDQRVPMLLFGAGIRPGTYDVAASPADIAPTMAATLGLRIPTAEGAVRLEALVRPPRLPRASVAHPSIAP